MTKHFNDDYNDGCSVTVKNMSAADELLDIIGNDLASEQEVPGWLGTGYPPLNKILSGSYDKGYGFGRIYEIFGPSSSGKTVLALNAMLEAQRKGGVVIMLDFERAFMKDLAAKLGLNINPPHFLHMYPAHWEGGHTKAMQLAEHVRKKALIDADAPILIVTDSIAAAPTKAQREKEIDEQTMNDTTGLARATSQTLKVINARGEEAGVTYLALNQIRLKPGVVYGDPTTTPGGGATEYYASGRLSVGRKKIIEKEGNSKQMVGQIITIKCTKSKHTRPFQETELYFMFREDGSGYFDVTRSLVEHLVSIGALEKSGARIKWTDGKTYFVKQLCAKIDDEGLQDELIELLPKDASEE